jgi:hypothetical protein
MSLADSSSEAASAAHTAAAESYDAAVQPASWMAGSKSLAPLDFVPKPVKVVVSSQPVVKTYTELMIAQEEADAAAAGKAKSNGAPAPIPVSMQRRLAERQLAAISVRGPLPRLNVNATFENPAAYSDPRIPIFAMQRKPQCDVSNRSAGVNGELSLC